MENEIGKMDEKIEIAQGQDTGKFYCQDELLEEAMNKLVDGLIFQNFCPDYWVPNTHARYDVEDFIKQGAKIHDGRLYLPKNIAEKLKNEYRQMKEEEEKKQREEEEKKKQEYISEIMQKVECDAPLPEIEDVDEVEFEGEKLHSTYDFYVAHKDEIKPYARWDPQEKVWTFFDENAKKKLEEKIASMKELQEKLYDRVYTEEFTVSCDGSVPECDVDLLKEHYLKFKEDAEQLAKLTRGKLEFDQEKNLWKVTEREHMY